VDGILYSDWRKATSTYLSGCQVSKINDAQLEVRDKEGKPYSVRYDQVNAMLLNEFLKEHKKVEEQQATIAELKYTAAQQQKAFESKLAKQEEQIEALTAGLQKVSAQFTASNLSLVDLR
jgi:septal ring factor EnvC (AmiA/AmiB activator)